MGVADLSSYRALYKSCMGLHPDEMNILVENLNSLMADESCNVNTSTITSADASAGGLPTSATEGCVDDDEALIGIFGEGDDLSCASAAASQMCSMIVANSAEICACSCPADGSGSVRT